MSPEPNVGCYIDHHDKPKTYGFSIHGCSDKLSERMLWTDVPTLKNHRNLSKISCRYCKTVWYASKYVGR